LADLTRGPSDRIELGFPMPPSQRGVTQLLIDSALDDHLRRRLLDSPDEVFRDFDLTGEEKDLLRHPDQRMLRLFGMALAQQRTDAHSLQARASAPQPHAVVHTRSLPDVALALTLVPCAQYENGRLSAIAYAVWVNPLPAGSDPASMPPPQGAALPGEPLSPLHAVIQVSAVQLPDRDGKPHVGLSAALRQSSNVSAPPPPESAGRSEEPPFGSDLDSAEVRSAVAAVRNAASEDRYGRLIDLIEALRGGEVR
jgi:hypothetical protein